jgi:hypothetical protein
LQVSIHGKEIIFVDDVPESKPKERVEPPEETPRVEATGSFGRRVCIRCR